MDVVGESSRIAEKVSLSTYCRLLEKLALTNGVKAKERILSKFISLWEEQYLNLKPRSQFSSCGRASLYLLLRLLIPSHDRLRKAFGLREHTLSRLIIRAIGLAPNGLAARILLRTHTTPMRRHSDFADIVYAVLKSRCREDSILSVKDINNHLDELATASSPDQRLDALRSLLHSTTAVEQKWIVRLIVKRDSGCGLSGKDVLKCLHPAAISVFEVTQDLRLLCERIADVPCSYAIVSKGTNSNNVTLFTPFRPMLCERANSADMLVYAVQQLYGKQNQCNIKGLNLLFETKFDGERVQLHKSKNSYRYWSRNGLEWTASYGEDGCRDSDRLTGQLHCGFANHVDNCILDGEMMIFSNWSSSVMSKPTKFDVKRSGYQNPETDNYQPCFVVFDILYLNGELLTSKSLLERKKLLLDIFQLNISGLDMDSFLQCSNTDDDSALDYKPIPVVNGCLYLSKWYISAPSQSEVVKAFNHLVDNHQEGLIVKIANSPSPYQPGVRNDSGWWKIKPDYIHGLLADLDCLIVGVRGDESYEAADSSKEKVKLTRFYTFCKVKSGLTIKQFKEIDNLLRKHWKVYDRKHPNTDSTEWLCVNTERPDVWIAPKSSLVLQLHGAELTQSDSYSAGLTLRFPRVVAIRHDKSWRDSLTMSELLQLNSETQGKLATKRLSLVPTFSGLTENVSDQQLSSLSDSNNITDNSSIMNQSSGYYTLDESIEEGEEEKQSTTEQSMDVDQPLATSSPVKQRRGVGISEKHLDYFEGHEICLWLSNDNPSPNTFCIVIDKITLKVKNLLNYPSTSRKRTLLPHIKHNVVRLHWLIDCFNKNYREPTTADELKLVFDDISCSTSTDEENKTTSKLVAPKLNHYSKLKLLLNEFKGDTDVLHPMTGYILALIRPIFNPNKEEQAVDSFALELQQQLMITDMRRLGCLCIGPICIYKSESISNLQSLLNSAYHNFLSVDSHTTDCVRSLNNKWCINPTHIVMLSSSLTSSQEVELDSWLNENYSTIIDWMNQFTRVPHFVKDTWMTECIGQNSWSSEVNHSLVRDND
uniref:DNA ligase n=1 Tax=Trichobilharzia regenti TaxID=157069 RepID=A0AA85JQK4_TRIRE|nr:unnamed protein product [Trichobilharzia regenti]